MLAATTIEPFNDLLLAIRVAQDTDLQSTDMNNMIGYPNLLKAGGPDESTNKDLDMQWQVITGALT